MEIELKEGIRRSQRQPGGLISTVDPGSPAAKLGIIPGDRLLAIDDQPIKDIIGLRFLQTEGNLKLTVLRQSSTAAEELAISKGYAEDIGIDFADPTFDGIKRCNNHCLFCFVDQMAPRFRHSLYIKDDDYRYSFLYGNFITMTNLKDEDWQRIDEERLTPLYYSVHATDMDCRRYIMGNPRVPDPLEQLRKMESINIQAHTQIVLCPGINDGKQLERSVFDLATMYPTVQGIGIVPVGLTKFRTRYTNIMRSYTFDEARAVIAQVEPWQRQFRKELGRTLVYLSDEWYLLTNQELPKAPHYDGFIQLENGVGMVRQLLDDHRRTLHRLDKALAQREGQPFPRRRVRLVCATMIGATMQRLVDDLNRYPGIEADILVLENELFGPQVTVSGLLTAKQVISALKAKGDLAELDMVFLPDAMFNIAETRTLDDYLLPQMQEELGLPLYAAENFAEVVDFMNVL